MRSNVQDLDSLFVHSVGPARGTCASNFFIRRARLQVEVHVAPDDIPKEQI